MSASIATMPPRREILSRLLYAEVVEEPSGMMVTVLSLLSRLGMDPWREAERLLSLPRPAAANELARIIFSTCQSCHTLPEAERVAARLVVDLPAGTQTRSSESRPAGRNDLLMTTMAIVLAVVWVVLFIDHARPGSNPTSATTPVAAHSTNPPATN